MTQSSVLNKNCGQYHHSSVLFSPCVQPEGRTCRIEPERFLQSEICRGSTAPKGRCPPGVLALHPERPQGRTVLLDSHYKINEV